MEIITGVVRRRRWRLEEKLRIVAEVEEPGASFVAVARRHEVSRGLLWNSASLLGFEVPTVLSGASQRKGVVGILLNMAAAEALARLVSCRRRAMALDQCHDWRAPQHLQDRSP